MSDRLGEALRIVQKSMDNEWTLDDEIQYDSVRVLVDAARRFHSLASEENIERVAQYLVAHESGITISVHNADRLAKRILAALTEEEMV